jgi:GNAT superfamily N-acetyltransferase
VIESARPAGADDLARLVELHREATAELRGERGGEVWAAVEDRDAPPDFRLDADDLLVLVATIDDVVVGYGRVERRALADGSTLAVVTDVYVEPAARGVGLGEGLLDLAIAWAREQGCRGIDSVALPGMRATKNFFESAGLVARAIAVHRAL